MSDPFAGLPRGHFGAILADPPWHFQVWAGARESGSGGGFCKTRIPDYKTLKDVEIAAIPVGELAAPDCVLFMWTCWPILRRSFAILDAWGFTYKTCAFSWMKADASQIDMFRDDADVFMGLGYWTRANSEPCLLATRGKPKRLNADVRQGIIAPRREHSRKPDEVHGRIERLVAGPYLELFARQERPGWTVWGNETTKFNGHRLPREPKPFECLSGQCRSPIACDAFGYCREKNFNGRPPEPEQLSWDTMWAKPFDRPELVGEEPDVAAIRRTLEGA